MTVEEQAEKDVALPLIYEALSAVMGDVTAVGKDSKNAQQNFNFRGIDAILNMVAPALRKHGVVVVPLVEEKEYEVVATKAGGTMGHATLKVRYRFSAKDGSFVETVVYAESMDTGDKSIAKAMSVAFRTALIQCLAIPTNDRDPDADTYVRGDQHDQNHQKIAATGEDIQRIRGMIRNAKADTDLTAVESEMVKFGITQADIDLIREEYQAKKAEIDAVMNGDTWKTDAKAAPPENRDRTVTASDEFTSIEVFASSLAEIETLKGVHTDLLNATDMPAILKIITANIAKADVGFPSVEDGEMTTLRIVSNHLPIMLASKGGTRKEPTSV